MDLEGERGYVTVSEMEELLSDLGYDDIPDHMARRDIVQEMGEGKLEVPPLKVAIQIFAEDYQHNFPYKPYSVDHFGTVAGVFDIYRSPSGTVEEREAELIEDARKTPTEAKAGGRFPYDGTHTGWIARAYAAEQKIAPDSFEAAVFAKQEVKRIMDALDEVRAKKGFGSPPTRVRI